MRVARIVPRRRFSGVDARSLRRAGAISKHGLQGFFGSAPAQPAQPAAWQVDPGALLALAKAASGGKQPLGRLGRLAYFRGFGLSPTATTVTEAVAGKAAAAGASAAATALGAGAAAGPIGLAAGAVIALALTLFQKQYFNVADANAACATQEQVWNKYLSVAGHVAGRALGWPTMIVVWHGAVGAGLFPLNSQHLSFHEGTLNCAGTGEWSDSFLGETLQGVATGCGSAANCMPEALQKFSASAVPAGTADAVYFVDSILLPMNAGAKIPWITSAATNPTVHQLLYDVADAYLAENNIASTPYVKYPAAAATAPATAAPAPAKVTTPVAAAPQVPAAQVPPFPGFSTSITATDPRLQEPWTETESGASALWTPTGNGFYSVPYGGVTGKIQIAISGNSMLGLRQDSDGAWGSYTGTFDSTGLKPSGQLLYYQASAPQGVTYPWSAVISAPAATVAPVTAPLASEPGSTAPMPASTMSETPTGGTAAQGSAPINVTVSAPAALAPASNTSTLLWVAVAGLGAVVLMTMMQHDHKRR